jgi:hypothetical protein
MAATFARWSGPELTAVRLAFMLFDATIKFAHIRAMAATSQQLGWPDRLNPALGLIILVCIALSRWPRMAVLGGAVAIHLRIGDPLASHALFPVSVGALLWAGFVRALVLPG